MGEKLNNVFWIRTFIIPCFFVISFNYCIAQEVLFDTLLNKNVLIGNFDFVHIQDSLWFKKNLRFDSLETDKIDELFVLIEKINVEVYFGSWCSDSHNWLPYFYLFSKTFMFQDKVQLIGLPKNQNYRNINYSDKNIERVPTFIVYREGNELGRIIENPENNFLEDFFSILNK